MTSVCTVLLVLVCLCAGALGTKPHRHGGKKEAKDNMQTTPNGGLIHVVYDAHFMQNVVFLSEKEDINAVHCFSGENHVDIEVEGNATDHEAHGWERDSLITGGYLYECANDKPDANGKLHEPFYREPV